MRAAWIALACGCAALGEEPFSERRDPTGIAPWTDLGAVEFCLGYLRLAPVGAEPLGVCVPGGAPAPAACARDGDCRGRERCLCGRCTAVACDTNADCGPDMMCDVNDQHRRCTRACETDDQCDAGEECQTGACRRPCGDDGECQSGEVCSRLGRCVAPGCAGDADCLQNEACVPQRTPRALSGPAVIALGGGLVMYVESDGQVLRAVSATGLSFRVEPDPVAAGGAPAAVRTGGGVTLYVERDGAILRAESEDEEGTRFGEAAPVADGSAPAAAGDDVYYVRDGAIRRAGAGGDEVVLAPPDAEDPLLWRAVDAVGDPAVLVVEELRGPIVRLFFAARGVESSSSVQFGRPVAPVANFSIGYAASDGGSFAAYPWNPVFDRTQAFLTHLEETGPAVVFHGGNYLLYYEAGDAGAPRGANIGVAVNPPAVPVE